MGKFIEKIGLLFQRAASFPKVFEEILHEKFLGIELYRIFAFLVFICVSLLLYLLVSARFRKTVRGLKSLENKFDVFKEEINLQIASLKFQKVPPANTADETGSKIEKMLESARKEPRGPQSADENTGIREIPKPEEFLEVPDLPKAVPSLDVDREGGTSREINSLIAGLEDVSNPAYKPSKPQRRESSQIKSASLSRSAVPKVTVAGNEEIGWNEKTALKPADEELLLESADMLEASTPEFKNQPQALTANVSPDDEIESTNIDHIDKNIELGSGEISINFEEEPPHKSLSSEGVIEERRDSNRVTKYADLELVFEGFSDFIKECSVNISKGGIFVKSTKLYPPGTKIKFNVRLKDGYKLLCGEAEVIRSENANPAESKTGGMGLKFLILDDDSRSLVDRIIQQSQG